MDILGYISEIIKNGPIPIGIDEVDEQYLYYILEGHTSAYKIHSLIQKQKGSTAYKNVHRRIKKLFKSELIEEVKSEGGFKHGAINYKLTTRGLVYFFSELGVPNLYSIPSLYSENILFGTFLYSYFEKKTIKSATYSLIRLMENYLEECCMITRYALDILVTYLEPGQTSVNPDDFGILPPIEKLYFQLNWHVKSFLLKVAIMKDEHIDWRDSIPMHPEDRFPSQEKILCSANDKIETYDLLSEDRKFMQALNAVQTDFTQGYQKLLQVKNNKKSK